MVDAVVVEPRTRDSAIPSPMTNSEEQEAKFVEHLRLEASELKDCFTKYSFQAIAIAGTLIAVIARFQHDHRILGIAYVVPIVLLLSVCSIGTHKYASVNRLLGYELHLQRTAVLRPPSTAKYWKASWRHIGWEEAMRAWRIIAPTLIDCLYRVPPQCPELKRRIRPIDRLLTFLFPDRVRNGIKTPMGVVRHEKCARLEDESSSRGVDGSPR